MLNRKPKKQTKLMRIISENVTAYLFIFPAFLVIAVFGLFPICYSVYMSLFNWRVRKGDFIGLKNYSDIIGDWTGLIYVLLAFLILIIAFWIWSNAFRSISNGKLLARIMGLVLIVAFGFLLVFGWGKMTGAGEDSLLKFFNRDNFLCSRKRTNSIGNCVSSGLHSFPKYQRKRIIPDDLFFALRYTDSFYSCCIPDNIQST